MANKAYTGLSKVRVTVPAKSVYNQQYLDTRPNYFRVQNHGNNAIYAGTESIPTTSNYDIKVESGKMKAFGEPFQRSVLYLYNPTATAIDVTILSFAAAFDPLILALSELDVQVDGSLSGEVSVTSMPALPAGTNKIGKVELDTYDSNQLYNMSRALTDIGMHVESMDGSSTAVNYTVSSGKYISELNSVVNDKTSSQTLTWYDYDTNTMHTFVLKAGEILTDLKVNARQVKWSGGRILFTVKTL